MESERVFNTVGYRVEAKLHPSDGFTVRISENARRMVVFFGAPSPKDGTIEYGGTGLLTLHRENGHAFGYLVTAKHVAVRVRPDSDVIVRVNDKSGSSVGFTVEDIFWAHHPDQNVDVAVTPCYIDPAQYDVGYYNLADMVRLDEQPFRVQCGDPICVIGLFHLHAGSSRNTPIVHSGNIALLPDQREHIPVKDRVTGQSLEMEAYLVEAQTLEGLSGAPVFHREMVALRAFPEHHGGPVIAATGAQLLGVYSGAWEGEPSAAIAADRRWAPDKRIPVGMGIVVPAERIWETIVNHEELKKRRAAEIAKKEESAVVMDSGLSASDANPNHRR